MITMQDSIILENYAILVSGEIIKDMFPAEDVKNHPQLTVIDGMNKFVIPGLTDSHCHVNSYTESYLKDFLDFGITSIRVCAGSDIVRN
jgi:imidazolonepropionase-like amidohydrolase